MQVSVTNSVVSVDSKASSVGNSIALSRKLLISEWWPISFGLLVLFVPTLYRLFTGLWIMEEQVHAPMILSLAIWLLYSRWQEMLDITNDVPPTSLAMFCGYVLFFVALLFYVVGRAVQINPMEMGSFILLLASFLLIKRGSMGLKILWFPLFFMLFMLPLPGPLVTMLTLPMKKAVSYVTEYVLYGLGYPISRSGVMLQIAQYQLLVADVCAGLQTLLTLEALGLFYLNLVRHTSAVRNAVLAFLIIPISFSANVIRVMTLTLITYYLGDDAGQGFLHGFAGMVLFVTALVLILSVDGLLQWIIKIREEKKSTVTLSTASDAAEGAA